METVINGMKTNYLKEGNGDNIVLLHGWGSNLGVFKQAVAFLSQSHTVYALDLPGCGCTDEPKEPLDATGYADFVNAFICKMEIKKTSLMGHSNGGRTAIRLATLDKRGFDIDKIILLDSAGIKAPKTLAKTLKTTYFKLGKWLLGLPPVKAISPNALDNLKNKCGSQDYRNASAVMKACMVKLINEDLTYLLPKVNFPTLLIWGEKDTATPLSDGKKMEQLIPDAGLVTLKNAGHYSFLEQPFVFISVLDSFLNGRR